VEVVEFLATAAAAAPGSGMSSVRGSIVDRDSLYERVVM